MKKHDKDRPAHEQEHSFEQEHSVRDVALILGVGKDRLFNAMKDAGMKTSEKITVAVGFTALSAKFQKQETLTRRQEAEAETAEIALGEKKGELVPKNAARLFVADATIEIRKVIQSRPSWKSKELLLALGKMKLEGK